MSACKPADRTAVPARPVAGNDHRQAIAPFLNLFYEKDWLTVEIWLGCVV